MNREDNLIWNTEALVLFGTWLLRKKQTGYGMLCVHAPILGIKIGSLLKLKWGDFIDPLTNRCETTLEIDDDKIGSRELSEYLQRITSFVFHRMQEEGEVKLEDYVYTNPKTGKVLTTSTLKRELQKQFMDFKDEVFQKTFLDLKFRPIETNSFEIAWGRDMVALYFYSKKAFIEVSKFLGHRTVAYTMEYLELDYIDEIRLRFDLYSPNFESPIGMYYSLEDVKWLTNYLASKKFANITQEYIEYRKQYEKERKAVHEMNTLKYKL